jgi:hypothetical protein
MSAIITTSTEGNTSISIYAPHTRTFSTQSDYESWVFNITGDAEFPFITYCRFQKCTIIADNLKAFSNCYFEDDCEMLVKDLPLVTAPHCAINNNIVQTNPITKGL